MITKPKTLNRILVAFVNFLLLILFTFIFDALVTSRITSTFVGYKSANARYETLQEEYKTLQDDYHIYIYDEENKRIVNPSLAETDKNNFLNDSRVISIRNEADGLATTIKLYTYIPLSISYILMSGLVYLVPTLIFKKRQNIGMKSFGVILTKEGEIPTRGRVILYLLIYIFFHLVVGLLTLFIFNIIDIMFSNFDSKDHRTLLERMFNYDLAIDFDKVEADVMSEERLYELTHSQNEIDK